MGKAADRVEGAQMIDERVWAMRKDLWRKREKQMELAEWEEVAPRKWERKMRSWD